MAAEGVSGKVWLKYNREYRKGGPGSTWENSKRGKAAAGQIRGTHWVLLGGGREDCIGDS